jgi:hypothetical protein
VYVRGIIVAVGAAGVALTAAGCTSSAPPMSPSSSGKESHGLPHVTPSAGATARGNNVTCSVYATRGDTQIELNEHDVAPGVDPNCPLLASQLPTDRTRWSTERPAYGRYVGIVCSLRVGVATAVIRDNGDPVTAREVCAVFKKKGWREVKTARSGAPPTSG